MIDSKSPTSNPIRDSKNRIKLGVFGINGNGAAFTFHPDRYQCTWDSNLRLAAMAEDLGFEAFVSAAHCIVLQHHLADVRVGNGLCTLEDCIFEIPSWSLSE